MLAPTARAARPSPDETPPADQSKHMAWFEQAKFGMFIHWGIYSVPAGAWKGKTNYAEWFQLETNMPAAQYALFAKQFNPTKFDAQAWVRTAKQAGMKYIVITAKHHDGFCMYDSKLTDYDVVDATPWHHDPMKDLARACHDQGMVLCFYYSIPDWHNPDFPAKYSQRATTTHPGFHGQPSEHPDVEKYVEYVKGQIRELLTNYGPIGIIWFDGGGSFGHDNEARVRVMHAQELIDEIHRLQPDCLVNNRLGLPGDYGTPEQQIPGEKSDRPWETCMTLNKHWGYNAADNHWKSPETVIRNLVDIASKGGNYLLNVGPKADGTFPAPAVEILHQVGDWMKINGDSIYGTSMSPLDQPPVWGRITQKGKTIYLHVFDWPTDGKLAVPDLPGKVKSAYLLADTSKKNLEWTPGSGGDANELSLPAKAPSDIDSVVVVECE